MTTRTHDTATTSASGSTPGGRGRGPLIAALVVIALVVLAGCVYLATRDSGTPPKTHTTTSVDPAAAREAALSASVAQVKALQAWGADNPTPGAEPPSTIATPKFRAAVKSDAALFKGYRVVGQDKVISIMPGSYSGSEMRSTVLKCLEVHQQVLDSKGNNVRTDPEGHPTKTGQHIGVTYTLIESGKTWLIDSGKVSATC